MSVSPDRRKPCGQTSNVPVTWFGGCFNHKDSTIDGIKIKRNVTQMKDYASGSGYDPNGIAPYSFANQSGPGGGAPICSPYWPGPYTNYVCGATGGTGNGSKPCGIPEAADVMPCGGSPTQSFTDGLGPFHNCFVQTEETKSFSDCRNLGFKNAYAYKTHFGRLSYNSRMYGVEADLFDWCGCGCAYHSYDPVADTTRYLSLSANASFTRIGKIWCINTSDGGTYDCGEGPQPNCCTSLVGPLFTTTNTGNAYNSVHVDKYSGNFYVDTCGSSSSCPTSYFAGCDCTATPSDNCTVYDCTSAGTNPIDPDTIASNLAYNANEAFGLLGMANGSIGDLGSLWSFYNCAGDTTNCRCTVTGGGSAWTATFEIRRSCPDGACNPPVYVWTTVLVLTIDWSGGQADRHSYKEDMHGYIGCPTDATCIPYDNFSHAHLSIGVTNYNYTLDYTSANSVSIWEEGHTEVNGTLGTPYTGEECYQDAVALLANLPLDRDDLLPWRRDTNINMGPLVHYDEQFGSDPYVGTCQSQTGSLPSGYIYGIPGPSGMDHVYNPAHWNYCICTDDIGCTTTYVQDFGAWNDEVGGGSVSEWTPKFNAACHPQGAFVSNCLEEIIPSSCNNDATPGKYVGRTLWLGKYAEIIFPKQSFNYARPCGADRFEVSGSSTLCFTGSAGGVLAIEPFGPDTSQYSNGTYVWVCGTPDLDGCWRVDVAGAYQLNLREPRVISASMVATQSFADCGSGCVAKLLWQNNVHISPAICGRADITELSSTSGSVTCSMDKDTYLVDGDTVRILNAHGGGINGYWTVLVQGPRTIGLVGAVYNTSSLYFGQGQMLSPFAADWKWDDTGPKNDYTVITWSYDFRKAGEYNRLVDKGTWNSGLGVCELVDGAGCQTGCGAIGTCPQPAVSPKPDSGCYAGLGYGNLPYGDLLAEVSCSTSCLPFNACTPSVAFFSPNDETFKNTAGVSSAKNHGFGHPVIDEQYGTLWQGAVKQVMTDLYYEVKPCPCQAITDPDTMETHYGVDCYCREDNGGCPSDQSGDPDLGIPCIKYYPSRPMYEARCQVPEGAPATVGGRYMGCLNVHDSTPCDKGNVCYPPYSSGTDMVYGGCPDGCGCYTVYQWPENGHTPWTDYSNKMDEVCNGCRFSPDYIANGFACDQELFVTPP